MRATRVSAVALAVAASTAVYGLALPGTAVADPTGLADHQIVGTGSDVTQDVLNGLADAVGSVDGYTIASYNATEPGTGSTTSTIRTRAGGPLFHRPNGANEGRQSLAASYSDTAYADGNGGTVDLGGQIDFARSTNAPTTSGHSLVEIPFARDAVTYAAKGAWLQNLTPQQLHDIYAGTLTSIDGHDIHPYLPQSGAGTTTFFLKAIGVTVLGSNVRQILADNSLVQQNRLDGVLTEDGDIVAASVSSLIAQVNGVAPDRSKDAIAAGAFIGSIALDGTTAVAPVAEDPDTHALAPNPAFYANTTFGRDVYNEVPTRAVDTTSIWFSRPLYDVFVTEGTHRAALASAAAEAVIAKYGFLNVPYNGGLTEPQHAVFGGVEKVNFDAQALPTAATVTATGGNGTLDVDWTTPAQPSNAPALTDYRVTVVGPDGKPVLSFKDYPATTHHVALGGLATGGYGVSVLAANLNGTGPAGSATATVALKAPSSVTVAAGRTVAYGSAERIGVTVANASGQVQLLDGTRVLGTATLNSAHQAVFQVLSSNYRIGTHTLTVRYPGSSTLLPSSRSFAFAVVKAVPAERIAAKSRVSHTRRSPVTVTLASPHTVPTGWVRIYDGRKLVGQGYVRNGKVVVTVARLAKGRHVLKVVYLGNSVLKGTVKYVTVRSV